MESPWARRPIGKWVKERRVVTGTPPGHAGHNPFAWSSKIDGSLALAISRTHREGRVVTVRCPGGQLFLFVGPPMSKQTRKCLDQALNGKIVVQLIQDVEKRLPIVYK